MKDGEVVNLTHSLFASWTSKGWKAPLPWLLAGPYSQCHMETVKGLQKNGSYVRMMMRSEEDGSKEVRRGKEIKEGKGVRR